MLTDQSIALQLLGVLPELVRRLCQLRQDGDKSQNDRSIDEEAEEEFFGEDENTHMGAWRQQGPTQKDMLLGGGDDEEDDDWEEEFNKCYTSPLDKEDELRLLAGALQGGGSAYAKLMTVEQQEQLSLYFTNAPPKNP